MASVLSGLRSRRAVSRVGVAARRRTRVARPECRERDASELCRLKQQCSMVNAQDSSLKTQPGAHNSSLLHAAAGCIMQQAIQTVAARLHAASDTDSRDRQETLYRYNTLGLALGGRGDAQAAIATCPAMPPVESRPCRASSPLRTPAPRAVLRLRLRGGGSLTQK